MSTIVVWFIGATGRDASSRTTIKLIFPRRSVIAALPPIVMTPKKMLHFGAVTTDGPERDTEPVRARLQLYDAQGNAIAGGQEVYLSFGEFRSYDVNRDELSSGSGRIQVRGEITYRLVDTPEQIPPDHSPAALELVDTAGEPILRRSHRGFRQEFAR
jgi:hypothetical protein